MIKQYFADGMISVAIILSLLRTDINQYLNNTNSLINYPEIHDIILGTSTAYTQTNFHNNLINSIGGYSVHPKHIENEYLSSAIIGELRSLSRFRRFHGINTDINAFLVNPPTSFVHHASSAETQSQTLNPQESAASDTTLEPSHSQTEDVNNNVDAGNTSAGASSAVFTASETEDASGAFAPQPVQHVFSNPFSDSTVTASNLTDEDMELIETLWLQDIDLGIGKEVFDLNLRRELERKREQELSKEREKQKELELIQFKLEQDRRQQAQNWLEQNFVQDGETGEWIAVNSSSNVSPQELQPNTDNQTQEFSFDEAFRILDSVASIPNGNLSCIENVTSNLNGSYLGSVTNTQAEIDHLIESVERFNNTENTEQMPNDDIQRQQFEQSWEDLVSVLYPSVASDSSSEPMDTAEPSPVDTLAPQNANVLLQNATMPQPILNSSVPVQPFPNNTFLPSNDPYANGTTMPPAGLASPVVWNTSGDVLFPNMTTPMNQTDALEGVEDLLPDLLADSELENISLDVDDMELTDSLQCLQMVDETSSDSAVSSMGSMASPITDFNETSTLGSMSPFDGVEGATGGTEIETTQSTKLGKYDPDDYNYNYSPYDAGDYSDQTNYSSSSNESNNYQQADLNQVQHNHSYPLQPGAQPKEVTKPTSTKPRQKGPHSRDEKRAREMKLPVSVDAIIESPVDEFNELLSKYKLTEGQLQLIRDIRRRGKNKVAAQNCRKRKLDSIFTLEDDLTSLKEARDKLLKERYLIDKQTREMKSKVNHLYEEVFQSLRDDHGQPYDPNEFSLQETSDGNVFLVPRNATSEQPPRKDVGRKRKEKK